MRPCVVHGLGFRRSGCPSEFALKTFVRDRGEKTPRNTHENYESLRSRNASRVALFFWGRKKTAVRRKGLLKLLSALLECLLDVSSARVFASSSHTAVGWCGACMFRCPCPCLVTSFKLSYRLNLLYLYIWLHFTSRLTFYTYTSGFTWRPDVW